RHPLRARRPANSPSHSVPHAERWDTETTAKRPEGSGAWSRPWDTAVVSEGDGDDAVVLPAPCLVVLAGPAGAGKSTWAAAHFAAEQVVSSDRLRATVGEGEDDLAASTDA